MELTDQELEELEGYYHQTLLPENMQKITEKMQKDSAYAKEASSFLSTLGMLEAGKYRTQAQYLMAESPSNLRVSWFKWPWAAIAAAAAVLLIVVGVWWMRGMSSDAQNHSELILFAEREFEPYPSLWGDMQDAKKNGMELYEEGKYEQAKNALLDELMASKIQTDTPLLVAKTFYLSMCHLATKDYSNATVLLERLNDSDLAPVETPWYLALSYILNNEPARAKPHLEKVSNGTTRFRQKSIDALKIYSQSKIK